MKMETEIGIKQLQAKEEQRLPAVSSQQSWRRQRTDSPPEPPEGARPADLDVRLWPSEL